MANEQQPYAIQQRSEPGMFSSGKTYVRNTVVMNPLATAIALGALVVLSAVLMYYVNQYKTLYNGCKKGSFMTQYPMTGLHSNWQLGGGDAGWGGSMHRETTPAQAAVYHPQWQGAGLERSVCNSRENLMINPVGGASGGSCGGSSPCRGPAASCNGPWDASATAEAHALATLGALPHDTNADGPLQATVNGAFDCTNGLDDNHLRELMHNGGAP